MPRIVYYVASSLDGFISGPQGDISKFALGGKGVEKYQSDLLDFTTVIMGRKTYEFGYQYGLVPGQPAYPHMEHHIFSDSMKLDDLDDKVHIVPLSLDSITAIRNAASSDVYLCGGGQLAGWLLDHGLIDQLKIKLNPIVLGSGVKLFGESNASLKCQLEGVESFDDGLQILTYAIKP